MSSASKSVIAAAAPSTNFVDALISATVVCDAIYSTNFLQEWTPQFEAHVKSYTDPKMVVKSVAEWGIVVVLAKLKTSGVVEVEDVYICDDFVLNDVPDLPIVAVMISNGTTGSTFTPFVGAFDKNTQVCCVSDGYDTAAITLLRGASLGLSSPPSFTLQRGTPLLTVDAKDPWHYSVAPTGHHSVGAGGAVRGSSIPLLSSGAKAFVPTTSVVRFGRNQQVAAPPAAPPAALPAAPPAAPVAAPPAAPPAALPAALPAAPPAAPVAAPPAAPPAALPAAPPAAPVAAPPAAPVVAPSSFEDQMAAMLKNIDVQNAAMIRMCGGLSHLQNKVGEIGTTTKTSIDDLTSKIASLDGFAIKTTDRLTEHAARLAEHDAAFRQIYDFQRRLESGEFVDSRAIMDDSTRVRPGFAIHDADAPAGAGGPLPASRFGGRGRASPPPAPASWLDSSFGKEIVPAKGPTRGNFAPVPMNSAAVKAFAKSSPPAEPQFGGATAKTSSTDGRQFKGPIVKLSRPDESRVGTFTLDGQVYDVKLVPK